MPETKQQTAMMMLRDKILEARSKANEKFTGDTLTAVEATLEVIANRINTELLAVEKQQHANTFKESRLWHSMIGFKHQTFDDYFNETFNPYK